MDVDDDDDVEENMDSTEERMLDVVEQMELLRVLRAA